MPNSEITDQDTAKWDVFLNEDRSTNGLFEVQWQTPKISINLIAKDLSFAKKIIDFIGETRNNPKFRDIPHGNGSYKSVEKELDLSECFINTSFCIGKDGEFDSRYYIRIRSGQIWLRPDIWNSEVDAFLETLHEIDSER